MAKPDLWRNRIIGSAEVAPDSLLAHPSNWRGHPANQQNALTDILGGDDGVGWLDTVMVNKRTSELWPDGDRGVETVVDGHLRVALAMRHNQPTVPVRYVDLTPAEEALALATFDPIGALATAQAEQLDAVLREVQTGSEAVSEMLAGLAEDAGLYLDKDKPEDPGAQVDKADELREKWKTKLGQLWQLGEHRLVCGDCTDKAVVERVMGEDRAEMMVTDPPYGVDYDPTWRADAGINKNPDKMGLVSGDDRADWSAAWALFPGDVAYVWHAGRMANIVQHSLESCGFEVVSQIVWAKDRFALSRGDYHWQHEPCWYVVRAGAKHLWAGARDQATVWEIPRADDSGHGHGTQKPLECMERPIRNHTATVVYDPFLGSGTTLIACERLGRKCRAVEIEPKYVAVALERFYQMSGKLPVLVPDAAGV